MLNNIKLLRAGNLNSVDNKMLYPILRWLSGSVTELQWIAKVNETFFCIPSDIAKGYIYIGLRDKNQFIKYPKGIKESTDKVFELKKSLLIHYYGWSENEFNKNINIIEFVDWKKVATDLACTNKELKLLGIQVKAEVIKQKIEQCKPKGIFAFT